MSEHLEATITDRGFKHLPPLPGTYGGSVCAYESSAAFGPHVWVAVETPNGDVIVHLTAENAWRLAEQLQYLVRNHYQGDATPESAEGK